MRSRISHSALRLAAAIIVSFGLLVQGLSPADAFGTRAGDPVLTQAAVCGSPPRHDKAPGSRHEHSKCMICLHASGSLAGQTPGFVTARGVVDPARPAVRLSGLAPAFVHLAYASRAPPKTG